MIRTKYSKHLSIPDAVNCSKKENYTQIPNDLLRNPEISGKAKALLCLLLSNSDNWHSYFEVIKTMMKEEEHAIRSGLKELEKFGYLKRVRYRDNTTKKLKGSFWAYCNTPFSFEYQKQLSILHSHNLETIELKPQVENSNVEKTTRGFSQRGKTSTKNTNIKEKQFKKTSSGSELISPSIFERFWKLYPKHPDKGKAISAWNKLCNKKERPTWIEIKRALILQIKTERWQNKQYIPQPTTWINQSRWLDDPKEMVCFDRQESSYTPKNNNRIITRPNTKYRVDHVINNNE